MARAVTVEAGAPGTADLSHIFDRALVFDDFFPRTHILPLEQWALQTPHWSLANSSYDEDGKTRHRIWGASYIQAVLRQGWPGLPPVLFSAVARTFPRLGGLVTAPRYRG